MSKFWTWLKELWRLHVGGAVVNVTTLMAVKVGEISLNIMLARTGQLTGPRPAYIGADGDVKMNAVRDELVRYAISQGIVLTSAMLATLTQAAAVPPATNQKG